MKRYLVLAGQDFYPNQGMRDLVGCFDTFEEIVKQVPLAVKGNYITRQPLPSLGNAEGYGSHGCLPDWLQVVDLQKSRFITIGGMEWNNSTGEKLMKFLTMLDDGTSDFMIIDDETDHAITLNRYINFE